MKKSPAQSHRALGCAKNNAATFKPYDLAETLGDTSPTNPAQIKPPKQKKCGMLGAVIIAVIAVAVTIVTSGAALAALSPSVGSIGSGIATFLGASGAVAGVGGAGLVAAGVVGGAVGSIVSQGVATAIGLQDKLSWKGVALSALSAGISAGIGPGGVLGKAGLFANTGPVMGAALRGATVSAATQGVGVATGLQDKFDWAGVAAAGVGAGVATLAGGALKTAGLGKFGTRLASNAAGAIANAATRSLVDGSSFGDNVRAALPDIIGQMVGGFIADEVVKRHEAADLKKFAKWLDKAEAEGVGPYTPSERGESNVPGSVRLGSNDKYGETKILFATRVLMLVR